jgi:hypothetical protein
VTTAWRRRYPISTLGIVTTILLGTLTLRTGVAVAASELDNGLEVSADTSYVIDGDAGVVRVTVDLTLTNVKPNVTSASTITRFYFDRFGLPVPWDAANISVTSDGARLTPTVTEAETGFFRLLEVGFSRLFYQQTRTIRVSFDIVGAAPRSEDSFVRVNPAFVSFFAWAYGDPGRGSVTIRPPRGLRLEFVGASPAATVDDEGNAVYVASAIDRPAEWVVAVTGFDDSRLEMAELDVTGSSIRIRYWPGDEEWRERVGAAMREAIPALAALTGLEWPIDGDLVVRQTVAPNLFGFAGWFLTADEEIEMGEVLDEHVIIHETAHAWFNDSLFDSRWINEGLADTVAALVLSDVYDRDIAPDRPRTSAAAPALNDWETPDFADEDVDAVEEYGYNASWHVVDAIFDQMGQKGLEEVLAAATNDEIAYVGAVDPEPVGPIDDWRRFLDLVEERGGAEVASALFADLVVAASERPALEARTAAREAYRHLATAGAAWSPPPMVRVAMGAWDFDAARSAIDAAEGTLEARDRVTSVASEMGLEPAPLMEQAYETANWSLNLADAVATSGEEALAALADAEAAVGAERGLLVRLGLRGEDPEEALEAARRAFAVGDLSSAVALAAAAEREIMQAGERGSRMVLAAAVPGALGGAVLLGLLTWLLIRAGRARRGRRTGDGEVAAGLGLDR